MLAVPPIRKKGSKMEFDRYSSMEVLIGDLIRLTAKTQVKLAMNERQLERLESRVALLERRLAASLLEEKQHPLQTTL